MIREKQIDLILLGLALMFQKKALYWCVIEAIVTDQNPSNW